MRYLVTGVAGFIGSHLADRLTADGHEVLGIDNLSTGRVENLGRARVDLVRADIGTCPDLARLVAGVDGVFHLAAVASVQAYGAGWAAASTANLSGSIKIFEAAAAAGARVVYASSAAVYGEPERLPLDEASPTMPISGYGTDKLAAEFHAAAMAPVLGLRSVGLRFFNAFGPRQDPRSPYSGVISAFSLRALDGTPATVFGDGTQTRDFVHVADIVRALIAAMDADLAAPATLFNICSGRSTSINDLVRILSEVTGRPLEVRHGPRKSGDIHASLGDGRAARDALGFAPRVDLADGLGDTLRWMAGGEAVQERGP